MDAEQVIQAQHGDEAAFARITHLTYPRLVAVAYRILRDASLAEDATQDTLVEAWRTLPRLRDPARFDAWTYRILVRSCQRETRRKLPPTLASTDEPSAPDELSRVDARDQVERGFRRLSVEHRAVVVLHHYQDLTIEQVADALGIPVGTAASRLSRAMTQLRLALHADTPRPEPALQEMTR